MPPMTPVRFCTLRRIVCHELSEKKWSNAIGIVWCCDLCCLCLLRFVGELCVDSASELPTDEISHCRKPEVFRCVLNGMCIWCRPDGKHHQGGQVLAAVRTNGKCHQLRRWGLRQRAAEPGHHPGTKNDQPQGRFSEGRLDAHTSGFICYSTAQRQTALLAAHCL